MTFSLKFNPLGFLYYNEDHKLFNGYDHIFLFLFVYSSTSHPLIFVPWNTLLNCKPLLFESSLKKKIG